MLIDFKTSNSLSFKDIATLSMVATSDKTLDESNTFKKDGAKFLKSAVIYGANGSGKTNFTNAFAQMRALILGHESLTDFSFKLDKVCQTKPSFFEVVFYYSDNLRYRYGFESNEDSVVSEWLFSSKSSRETCLFTRENKEVTLGRSFSEGKKFKSEVKKADLFLSLVAHEEGKIASEVRSWFKSVNIRSGLESSHINTLHKIQKGGEDDKIKVLDILHSFDIQMEDFIIREREPAQFNFSDDPKLAEEYKEFAIAMEKFISSQKFGPTYDVFIVRRAYDDGKDIGPIELGLLKDESDGTQKLFELAGYIVDVLDKGGVLIIDELESKLHPLVTRELVKIFNSNEKNPLNAQLIFTTHDTNLLKGGHFRRDQIWFTEKDKYGASHLYSLAEYKEKPRKDASLEKDYVKGRFGAIPFIGDFSELIKKD